MNSFEDAAVGHAHALKCELAGEVLRSSGTLRLQAAGRSMLPSIWPGDMLVVEPADRNSIGKGDIALFGRGRSLFAHRVVAKASAFESRQIITQGDGMPRPDPPVSDSELLGKVVYIVRNGRRIEPSKSLRFSARAVAALVRFSESAARVLVAVHGLRQTSQHRAVQCQN